jgi:hypothetical protein
VSTAAMQQILSHGVTLKTAKMTGIEVLTSILLRADNVVEWWAMSVIGSSRTSQMDGEISAVEGRADIDVP